MTTYDLTFALITEDSLNLQVTAQNRVRAVEIALNQLSEDLSSNQTLQLTGAEIVSQSPVNTNSNGYTSLASLYTPLAPNPPSSFPEIPGYNRLVN